MGDHSRPSGRARDSLAGSLNCRSRRVGRCNLSGECVGVWRVVTTDGFIENRDGRQQRLAAASALRRHRTTAAAQLLAFVLLTSLAVALAMAVVLVVALQRFANAGG